MAIIKESYLVERKEKYVKTEFNATLRFKKEIAPNQRAKIWERLNYLNSENSQETNIKDYLEKENFCYFNNDFSFINMDYFYKQGIKLFINLSKRKLGLKLDAIAGDEISRKSIIKLDDLNNFILTGNLF